MEETGPRTRPRERFSRRHTFTPESTAAFAAEAGDTNPIHHDPDAAARTRFGRPIASGPHTGALLMGLTAAHFSRSGPMLGLEFSFRFKKPVFADATVTLEWMVVGVRPSARLGGDLVELRGRLVDEAGDTAVGAKGRVLLLPKI